MRVPVAATVAAAAECCPARAGLVATPCGCREARLMRRGGQGGERCRGFNNVYVIHVRALTAIRMRASPFPTYAIQPPLHGEGDALLL